MDQQLSEYVEPWEWTIVSHDVVVSEYKNQTRSRNVVHCDYRNKPNGNTVCAVDVDAWEPCTSANTFDYLNSEPCVFIKLNKVCLLTKFYDESKKSYYDVCAYD